MGGNADLSGAVPERREIVVVPHRPGPLVSLDATRTKRGRDDLDELIDELFPDVDEGAGVFDIALLAVGAALLTWAWVGETPWFVVFLGFAAFALGCVLPVRTAWRRIRDRRVQRRHQGLLEQGVPIDVSSPAAARLVGVYGDLVGRVGRSEPNLGASAISAAHSALMEVASLLRGRPPATDSEIGYVNKRAVAIAGLVEALRELPATPDVPADDLSAEDAAALVEAREEVDRIAAFTSIERLDELAIEVGRVRRRDRS